MPTPVARARVWLDDEGHIHTETDDGSRIELNQDDPSLTKLRSILEAQRDNLRAEQERAQREARRKLRPFDCPLTESKCTEVECSRTLCIRQQREQDLAGRLHAEERARLTRGSVKVRKSRSVRPMEL